MRALFENQVIVCLMGRGKSNEREYRISAKLGGAPLAGRSLNGPAPLGKTEARRAAVRRLGDDQPTLAQVLEMGKGREASRAGQRRA